MSPQSVPLGGGPVVVDGGGCGVEVRSDEVTGGVAVVSGGRLGEVTGRGRVGPAVSGGRQGEVIGTCGGGRAAVDGGGDDAMGRPAVICGGCFVVVENVGEETGLQVFSLMTRSAMCERLLKSFAKA